MTLRDKWWYFNYRWHKWRLERSMKSCAAHIDILDSMGVEKLNFRTYGVADIFAAEAEK